MTDFYKYQLMDRVAPLTGDDVDFWDPNAPRRAPIFPDADDDPTPRFSALHLGRRLFQESFSGVFLIFTSRARVARARVEIRSDARRYCLIAYCKREHVSLDWMRMNQTTLRADSYRGLADAVRAGDAGECGRRVVLGPSFKGGPRDMHKCFHDGMAIVRNHGKPHKFITFTCNPNWPEIKDNLLPKQTPNDRPDLIARVFHAKLKYLIHLLTKENIFGELVGYMYSIEYQKRGLPHAHILIIQHQSTAPDDVDKCVSASVLLQR